MRGRLAFLVSIGAVLLTAHRAHASVITVFADKASFDAGTLAVALTIPDASYFRRPAGHLLDKRARARSSRCRTTPAN
jgi:hypothetical protein